MKLKASLFAVCIGASSIAAAHHSFAMFDQQKPMTLKADVKEFQWTNPHAWLQVMAPDSKGQLVEWSLELGSPNALSRSGIKKNTFKPGDQVTVEIFPLKDGTPGGALSKAVFADGKGFVFGVGGNTVGPIN